MNALMAMAVAVFYALSALVIIIYEVGSDANLTTQVYCAQVIHYPL